MEPYCKVFPNLFSLSPLYIKEESMVNVLVKRGLSVRPKKPGLKHVMSLRWQTHMVLNADCQSLNVSAKMTLQSKDYTIFISTDSMKCFKCGKYVKK